MTYKEFLLIQTYVNHIICHVLIIIQLYLNTKVIYPSIHSLIHPSIHSSVHCLSIHPLTPTARYSVNVITIIHIPCYSNYLLKLS